MFLFVTKLETFSYGMGLTRVEVKKKKEKVKMLPGNTMKNEEFSSDYILELKSG